MQLRLPRSIQSRSDLGDLTEIGPISVRDRSEIGPRSVRDRAEIGPRSGRDRAEIGPRSGRDRGSQLHLGCIGFS